MGDAFRTASTRLRRKYAVRSGSCQPSAEFVDSYFFLGSRFVEGDIGDLENVVFLVKVLVPRII